MRAVGRANAAVTLLNALWNGTGAAAAIDLACTVELEVRRQPPGELARLDAPQASLTPLVRASIARGLREFHAAGQYAVRLEIRSAIPPARGLKSSSAVSCALLEGLARSAGRDVDAVDVARLSAEISRAIGLSATGAFDDALAALRGGVVLTDNASCQPLAFGSMPTGRSVLLWIPPGEHPPSAAVGGKFAGRAVLAEEVAELVRRGEYPAALERNGVAVERAMGYRYAELRQRLTAAGAEAAGVTGLGPVLAAIASDERRAAVRGCFAGLPGQVIETTFLGGPDPGPGSGGTDA